MFGLFSATSKFALLIANEKVVEFLAATF